jgi:hypothetical protein
MERLGPVDKTRKGTKVGRHPSRGYPHEENRAPKAKSERQPRVTGKGIASLLCSHRRGSVHQKK